MMDIFLFSFVQNLSQVEDDNVSLQGILYFNLGYFFNERRYKKFVDRIEFYTNDDPQNKI